MGLTQAGHTESDPHAEVPLLVLASCPVEYRPTGAPRLTGKLQIKLMPGSRAFDIYGQTDIEESFACNYELNPVYRGDMENGGIKVSGVSSDGGVRIIELSEHLFFLATGFLPQLGSSEKYPHPLMLAYLRAAARFADARSK